MGKKIGIVIVIVIIFLTCLYLNFGQEKAASKDTIRYTMSNDMDQSYVKDDSAKKWNNSSIESEDKENPDMDVSLQELEKILKSNLLEDIAFQESERAIFYYRARMKQFFDGYVVLVYKETVEKDIVYVGPLGIEKETGNMYQLKDGEYVLVNTGVLKGFALPDIPQDEFWVEWEAGSDDEDYKLSEEVYTAVFDCLKENGVEHNKFPRSRAAGYLPQPRSAR